MEYLYNVKESGKRIKEFESIKERGVITPATVRQKENGRYELISGHRRKRECELAGFERLICKRKGSCFIKRAISF